MRQNLRTAQAGYALLLMVLALMGVGGVVVTGFTQGVKVESEHERYLHNQRVLREAKQALLQYAYNYPQLGPGQNDGPGRLLCPDTNNDNDGLEEYVANCAGNIVGRFPWGDPNLNFYDARDASGERLWYAVSPNFGRGPGSEINSGSFGGITVEDRSGAILHDGTATIPAGGVAAVIIAPGAPIDRNGTMQVRGTDDEKTDAVNYLDLFGTRDNAVFVNGDPNGFVTGPIEDVATGDLLVNDQMIIVTAAEIIAMAEKATLQAYRTAILDYLDVDNTAGVYPWLYNYKDVVDLAELSGKYPADLDFAGTERPGYLGNYGRIPSIFANYFELNDEDSVPLRTELTSTLEIDYGAIGPVSRDGGADLEFNPGIQILSLPIPAVILDDVKFESPGGSIGRVSVTLPAAQTITHYLYFWDEDATGMDPTGYWTLCPDKGDNLSDCWRDSSRNPDPGGTNANKEEILRLELKIDLPATLTFDADYTTLPTRGVNAATATSHATIEGRINGNNLDFTAITTPTFVTPKYLIDHHYHDDGVDETLDSEESGELTSMADLLAVATLTLTMRYYPELPYWVYENGWHNSIRMAYADDYRPDTPAVPCTADVDCLQIADAPGAPHDKISLLVIAGEHDWTDDGDAGLQDDLADVFDAGNVGDDAEFLAHEGNDEILVIKP
jgi:hypothetical protein